MQIARRRSGGSEGSGSTESEKPWRFVVGAVLASILVLGLAHALLNSQLDTLGAQEQQRVGIVTLNAFTQLVQGIGDDGERLRRVAATWQQRSGVRSLRVLRFSGVSLEASTEADDVGEKAPPRRLSKDEKSLYDLGQRLRAAVETNREEGVARKDEIELAKSSDGALRVSGPLLSENDVVGLVEVVVPPQANVVGASWSPAVKSAGKALLYVAVLIGLLLRPRVVRWPLFAVGVVGLLFSLLSHGHEATRALKERHAAVTAQVANQAKLQGTHLNTLASEEGLSLPSFQVGNWDTTPLRENWGELSESGEAKTQPVAPPMMGRTLVLLSLLGVALFSLIGFGAFNWLFRTLIENRTAYGYISPAMLGMLTLVFFPFFYGVVLSFTDATLYNANKSIWDTWIGLKNYADIIFDFDVIGAGADGGWSFNYSNFYYTLMFTIVWTVTNVTIGVSLGLALALVLNIKNFAFRPVYRVLLILPWAVPNYITALVWKGMFHRQFGVINHMLALLGFEPRSWFDQPLSSFATALATNGWLSFPFMMVVSLGALQSIPDELYEAAEVDGASRWQQFLGITLPALRPALVPAIILSVVWTFNMFNIIYLVTGGEPGGATEILLTQAYKFAFEKYRYGYAAAYSMVIFMILLMYGVWQNRVSRGTEA